MVLLVISAGAALLISGAMTAAGAVASGIAAKHERRRQRAALKKMRDEENSWAIRKINEDFLERAETKAAIEKIRSGYQMNTHLAQGRQDMLGGSNAVAAAQKEAEARGVADLASNVVASSTAAKDRVEEQHRQRSMALDERENDIEAQAAQDRLNNIQAGLDTVNNATAAYVASGANTTAADATRAANTAVPFKGSAGEKAMNAIDKDVTAKIAATQKVGTNDVYGLNKPKPVNASLNIPSDPMKKVNRAQLDALQSRWMSKLYPNGY